jgi:hypothetical protein
MMEQLRLGRRVNGVTMTLLKTLSFTRDCSSTDPRDKVFGIYGISEDTAEGIEIDYTKPVEAVYTDVSRFLIADAKDLTLLSLVQTPDPTRKRPSWVPDWSEDYKMGVLAQPNWDEDLEAKISPEKKIEIGYRGRRFRASSSTKAIVRLDEDNVNNLIVSGLILGAIKGLGPPVRVATARSHNGVIRDDRAITGINTDPVRNEWYAMLLSLGERPYPITRESYRVAFARTIIADGDRNRNRATRDLYGVLEQYLEFHEINEQMDGALNGCAPEALYDYETALLAVAGQRRFFVDEGGWIGLAPKWALEGDNICLLFGGNVPFVLRDRGDGKYQFVGECYVHGIMDGEIMKAAAGDREVGGLLDDLIQEFTLT